MIKKKRTIKQMRTNSKKKWNKILRDKIKRKKAKKMIKKTNNEENKY